MNDFMVVFNEYGWEVFYFAGLCTGCIISLLIGFISTIADAITEFIKEKKERNKK